LVLFLAAFGLYLKDEIGTTLRSGLVRIQSEDRIEGVLRIQADDSSQVAVIRGLDGSVWRVLKRGTYVLVTSGSEASPGTPADYRVEFEVGALSFQTLVIPPIPRRKTSLHMEVKSDGKGLIGGALEMVVEANDVGYFWLFSRSVMEEGQLGQWKLIVPNETAPTPLRIVPRVRTEIPPRGAPYMLQAETSVRAEALLGVLTDEPSQSAAWFCLHSMFPGLEMKYLVRRVKLCPTNLLWLGHEPMRQGPF